MCGEIVWFTTSGSMSQLRVETSPNWHMSRLSMLLSVSMQLMNRSICFSFLDTKRVLSRHLSSLVKYSGKDGCTRRIGESWLAARWMTELRLSRMSFVSAISLPMRSLNAAIERGVDPGEWTLANIEKMKDQLKSMNTSFNWENVRVWLSAVISRLIRICRNYQHVHLLSISIRNNCF